MRITALLDALAVLAPTECSGCGAHDRALCDSCLSALTPSPREIPVGDQPVLRVWAALDYGGAARRVLLAYKDGGRTDAASALAPALRAAVVAALAGAPSPASPGSTVRLATIPSTRLAYRRRGYHPVELVLARAGLRAQHPLRIARQTEDQAGLGHADRAENRRDSLRARDATGHDWLLIDDILTTGSTLIEAARAVRAGGGRVLGAAVIARTPLRRTPGRTGPLRVLAPAGDLSRRRHYGRGKGVDDPP